MNGLDVVYTEKWPISWKKNFLCYFLLFYQETHCIFGFFFQKDNEDLRTIHFVLTSFGSGIQQSL